MGDSTEVERLLREIRQQGSADGEGSFSWNIERAMALLPSAQLADESDFLLRLVASAVASGAREFRVEALASGYRVSWDGRPFTHLDLELMFSTVLASDPRLSDLVVGARVAGRLYSMVELQGADVRLSLSKNTLSLDRRDGRAERTSLVLSRPGWKAWLARWRGNSWLNQLRARCQYAPLKLILPDGAVVTPPPIKNSVVTFGEVPPLGCEVIYEHDGDGSIGRGYLVLGVRRGRGILVHHGVSYSLEKDFLPVPGHLIWWHDGLSLDLSRSNLVRGSALKAWREALRLEIERALRAAQREWRGLRLFEEVQEWLRWSGEGESGTPMPNPLVDLARAHAHHQNCVQHVQAHRYEEAVRDAALAAEINGGYFLLQAICLGLLGSFAESLVVFERAINVEPERAACYASYAEALEQAQLKGHALEMADRALRLEPDNSQALSLKARILAAEDLQGALTLAREASMLSDCPASVWETIGNICLRLEQPEGAREALHRFLELANPATLWEYDLPSRLEKARKQLAQLG